MGHPEAFLDSKSMLTPGVAGGVVMLITGTLGQQFDLPHRWVALALSFAVATLVFADRKTPGWQRILIYVLNGFIVFSMAVGANSVGGAVAVPDTASFQDREVERAEPFFVPWL